ncbi:RNI-like superfamily protein [Tanacetum coccineum]
MSITNACPLLSVISLYYCSITDTRLEALTKACKSLKEVSLEDAEYCPLGMDATGVSRILSGGGLEYLNLSNGTRMGDGLAAIGLGFATNLKILHFCDCRFVKDDVIIQISKGCPLLQEWDLSFCERIGIRDWDHSFKKRA